MLTSLACLMAVVIFSAEAAISAAEEVSLSEGHFMQEVALPWQTEQPEVRSSSNSKRIVMEQPVEWSAQTGLYTDILRPSEGAAVQNMFIARVHRDDGTGAFCWSCRSSSSGSGKLTVKKRFARNMPPLDAAEVLVENIRPDAEMTDLNVLSIEPATMSGLTCFKVVYEYRCRVGARRVLYRTTYYGLVIDDWFYGIGYTGTVRYYYERDIEKFENVIKTVRFEGGPN